MARYIDAERLLEEDFTNCWADISDDAVFEKIISLTPTADVVEVKHGEWIDKRWTTECDWCDMNHHSITCSVCKEETYGGIKTKYCPDCGAEMDGKKGE